MRRGCVWLTLLLLPVLSSAELSSNQGTISALRDEGGAYSQVLPGHELVFPRDHAAHPSFRIEWWYLTANLKDDSGNHWGLQWTLFRQALSAEDAKPNWSNNQMWMAHAAITTPDGHFYEQRFARGGIGQAGVKALHDSGQFEAWIDDWHWESQDSSLFPSRLDFTVGDRTIAMQLESEGDFVLNGDNGYSQKSSQGQASYYYSQPHIAIQGYVDDGSIKTGLEGVAWLDREWSSQALAKSQQGWDWFSIHLHDGAKLMLYQLRQDDGEHWVNGTLVRPDGSREVLAQSEMTLQILETRRVKIAPGQWRQLPLDWLLSLPDRERSWRIRPLYDAQWMATSFPYWEGVILVEDEQAKPAGIGYMELTGYE